MSVRAGVVVWLLGAAACGAFAAVVVWFLMARFTGRTVAASRLTVVILLFAAIGIGIFFHAPVTGDGMVAVFGGFANLVLSVCFLIGGAVALSEAPFSASPGRSSRRNNHGGRQGQRQR